MHVIQENGTELCLSPDRALYVKDAGALLVADVHLGKSETFQRAGIPIPTQVNGDTLERLLRLCQQFQPQQIWILGDLFHAREGMGEEVFGVWSRALEAIARPVHLILGNHDRALAPRLTPWGLICEPRPVALGQLLLSHEPVTSAAPGTRLNVCGHIHPCLRLQTPLDSLRLPCFFLDRQAQRLMLPSFGEFTGGYEITPGQHTAAYAIAEQTIIAFEGLPPPKARSPRRFR